MPNFLKPDSVNHSFHHQISLACVIQRLSKLSVCEHRQVHNGNSLISRDADSVKQMGLIDCCAFEKLISVSPHAWRFLAPVIMPTKHISPPIKLTHYKVILSNLKSRWTI